MTNFALRVPDHVMEQAKAAASEDSVSINQMLVSFIAEGLGQRRGLRMMQERAARADIGASLSILERRRMFRRKPAIRFKRCRITAPQWAVEQRHKFSSESHASSALTTIVS